LSIVEQATQRSTAEAFSIFTGTAHLKPNGERSRLAAFHVAIADVAADFVAFQISSDRRFREALGGNENGASQLNRRAGDAHALLSRKACLPACRSFVEKIRLP